MDAFTIQYVLKMSKMQEFWSNLSLKITISVMVQFPCNK